MVCGSAVSAPLASEFLAVADQEVDLGDSLHLAGWGAPRQAWGPGRVRGAGENGAVLTKTPPREGGDSPRVAAVVRPPCMT